MQMRALWFGMTCAIAVGSFFLGRYSVYWQPLEKGDSAENAFELPEELAPFLDLYSDDYQVIAVAFKRIRRNWSDGSVTMLLEVLPFVSDRRIGTQIIELLEELTTNDLGEFDRHQWLQWLWNSELEPHPDYWQFKAALYSHIDYSFSDYFDEDPKTEIRLDEIVWGGVLRDGIPPLDHPTMIPASEASYLEDSNIVFGVEIDGDARAYPKRILAYHEMVKDLVGGKEINGVYCTLCGSMIVYDATFNGQHYELGTSGFLYRSNKLMYDHGTRSLWNTLIGKPVVGPLVGKGIQLQPLYVVTTTWGEWLQRHPDTQVLSLETGHTRDYREGQAYREYFATDDLMFPVPQPDDRLKNKAEVLALRFDQPGETPLAISTAFLSDHPAYYGELGGKRFVVLTDLSGASRVFETGGRRFTSWDRQTALVDGEGQPWQVSEAGLIGEDGQRLDRLPAHRAFWFGWHAAHPQTRLVEEAEERTE